MKIKILRLSFFFPIFISLLFIGATSSLAQKKKKAYPVHAKDSLVIDTHSSKTLSEALAECIRKAQMQAIKDRFGTNLSEDKKVNMSTIDGVSSQSFFATLSENLKGRWLRETQTPSITVDYKDGALKFIAEVWGEGIEITKANTDVKWSVLNEKGQASNTFLSGERLFVNFRSPINGYVAVYILNESTAYCCLPFPEESSHPVKGGQQYMWVGKEDTAHPEIQLTTDYSLEAYDVVLLFSSKAFSKTDEQTGDSRTPSNLPSKNFKKWLQRIQLEDSEMVVREERIIVRNTIAEQ